MRDALAIILAVLLVAALGLVGVLAAPAFQSAELAAATQAAEHLERARRLIARYEAGLALLPAFGAAAPETLAPERLEQLVEANPGFFEQLDQALQAHARAAATGSPAVPEAVRDRLRELGYSDDLIDLTFEAAARIGRARAALEALPRAEGALPVQFTTLGPDPSAQARHLASAADAVLTWRQRNAHLLDDARAELDRALQLRPDSWPANMLRAFVEVLDARSAGVVAIARREHAAAVRRVLDRLLSAHQRLRARIEAHAKADPVAAALQAAHRNSEQLDAALAEARRQLDQARQALARREAELAEARQAAEQAELLYDRALKAPYDSQRPGAFAAHIEAIEQAAARWRQAQRRVRRLEDGDAADALPALADLRRERDVARARYEQLAAAREAIRQQAEGLAAQQAGMQRGVQALRSMADQLLARAGELFDLERRLVAEAQAAEQRAAEDLLPQAVRYFDRADAAARRWVSDAAAVEDPLRRPVAEQRQRDRGWRASSLFARGEALLLKAEMALVAAADARARLPLLRRGAQAGVPEIDPAAVAVLIDQARQAAREAVAEARKHFDQAAALGLPWIAEGTMAAAWVLEAQIDGRPESWRLARNALEMLLERHGDSPYARPFADLLAQLPEVQ